MTNPYMPPPAVRPAPGWARKRYLLPALALIFLLGTGIGAAGGGEKTAEARPAAAGPTPTETVTATATATVTQTPEAEPAPTVTVTKTVTATRTVTAEPAAGGGFDDSSGSDTGVYYGNCSEARAAGAAPIHRGEPGYASHLDRDNDGVACDA
ncbi:excalibur calcium-binding domain-containing protein [Streptomyces sp. NPDC052023]|uniref:excalibur calcium-binding domain-containing protein n=1 Tax=Streptomyces sp. NPDC052023 TaxID=3365681 RepID=UPI0037D8E869